MIYAGVPSFFALGSEDGHVPSLNLRIYITVEPKAPALCGPGVAVRQDEATQDEEELRPKPPELEVPRIRAVEGSKI